MSDLRERVTAVLATEVAPALAMDGVTVEVVAAEGGTVRVRLTGAASCPASVQAVILGI